MKVNRAGQSIPHLPCRCFPLLPSVDAFSHNSTVSLFSSLFLSSPFPPIFLSLVRSSLALLLLLWLFNFVYSTCSLRFLKEDTKTGALLLWSVTPWVRALMNCTSNKIFEIFSVL